MPRSRRSRRGNCQVPRPSRRGGSSYPRQSTQGLVASQPNEYNPHSRIRRRFRFVAVGALNSTISGSCLLNLLHHATAAAVSYSAFQAVRLLHVEVWGAPVTGPTYSEITFKWLAHRSEPMVFDDRGTVQCPGHIKQRPPRNQMRLDGCPSRTPRLSSNPRSLTSSGRLALSLTLALSSSLRMTIPRPLMPLLWQRP